MEYLLEHLIYKTEDTRYYDIENEIVVYQNVECSHCHNEAILVRKCGVMMGILYCPGCDA